jgi:hypothetical protein
MAIKINYLTPSDKNKSLMGRMVFLNEYKEAAIDFPYFYLGPKSETINYSNWPDLVPYLYDKKLGFFVTINNNYQFKDNFKIFSFSLLNGILTLNFTDEYSLKALLALYEDRETYYFENNTYVGWNRTITPINNIDLNNKVYLTSNQNYNIDNIEIISDLQINLKIRVSSLEIISLQILNNKNVEFGLYRIEGRNRTQSIYYHGLKTKYFTTSNSNDLIGGLRTRSQVIGHSHEHTHDMGEHTHTMIHTHTMSNHRHAINHTHTYIDSTASTYSTSFGPVLIPGGYGALYYGYNVNVASTRAVDNRTTNNSRNFTDGASPNLSGQANNQTMSPPANLSTNNNTSFNLTKTTNKDEIYSTDNNFKVGNKNYYDSNISYVYIYGLSYFAA